MATHEITAQCDVQDETARDRNGGVEGSQGTEPASGQPRKRRSDVFGPTPAPTKRKQENMLTPSEYKAVLAHVKARQDKGKCVDTAALLARYTHMDGVSMRRELRRVKKQLVRQQKCRTTLVSAAALQKVSEKASAAVKLSRDVVQLEEEKARFQEQLQERNRMIASAMEIVRPVLTGESSNADDLTDLCSSLTELTQGLKNRRQGFMARSEEIDAEDKRIKKKEAALKELESAIQSERQKLLKAKKDQESTDAHKEIERLSLLNDALTCSTFKAHREAKADKEIAQKAGAAADALSAQLAEATRKAQELQLEREKLARTTMDLQVEKDTMASDLAAFETCTLVEGALTSHRIAFTNALVGYDHLKRKVFSTAIEEQCKA